MSNFNIVPACPQGLTISKEDFLSPNFTVDSFLLHWNTALTSSAASTGRPRSLETLRDDLGIYLKVLRSSMIELINEDYADFVNLSTNLVDLDKGIGLLEEPLLKYKSEVLSVRQALDATIEKLQEKLDKRKSLYAKKIALQNLEHITNTLSKVERIIETGQKQLEHQGKSEMSGDLVERVATEINHLNFCVSKCDSSVFIEELQPRLKTIGDHLHGSLENQMMDALSNDNIEVLKRCLRIFVTVDRARDAETLVRTKIIRPYLQEHVTEAALNSFGLKTLLSKVLEVTDFQLQILLRLTANNAAKQEKDFNFMVNSLWPEIVEQIDDNIAFIFSAGNPEKFFNNYKESMNFLNEFEKKLGDIATVEQFRETESYTGFLGRWNLPVYFRIRFQEIALPVENALLHKMFVKNQNSSDRFKLQATAVTVQSIEKCWDDSVYFPALAHRFWKLTLQIISRYSLAAALAPEQEILLDDDNTAGEENSLKPSATVVNLQQHQKLGHKRSSSDTSSKAGLANKDQQTKPMQYKKKPEHIINLWVDVSALVDDIQHRVKAEVILPKLGELTESQEEAISVGLEESGRSLLDLLPQLSDLIVSSVLEQSLPLLKQVGDIPRLYRRTNREIPNKPCTYLTSLLTPIAEFNSNYSSSVALHTWLVMIFEKITAQLLISVNEVLAAVQKMEESLRRLKRVRDSKAANLDSMDDGSKTTVSDDDKIRLQLYFDVKYLIKQMESEFKVSAKEVKKLEDLEKIVTEATVNMESSRMQ